MKYLKPFIFLPLLITVFISSCKFNSQYINREEDKAEAEQVLNKFYMLLKSNNYEATYKMFSTKFWEVTSKEEIKEIFTATRKKLGDQQSVTIDKWETRRVEGTNPSADYVFQYKNKYTLYEAVENIRLTRENNEIKIVAYNINSNGFMK